MNEWLDAGADEPFLYLTTTGRRTGRPHRIEIWFAIHDRRIYMLSGGRDRVDWVRNLKADPRVTVELGDQTRPALARVLEPTAPDDGLARQLLVARYGATEGDLDEWGRTSLPVVVEPLPGDA